MHNFSGYCVILPLEGLSARYRGRLETSSEYGGTQIAEVIIDVYVGSGLIGSISFNYLVMPSKTTYPTRIEFSAYKDSRYLTINRIYSSELLIPSVTLPFEVISTFLD